MTTTADQEIYQSPDNTEVDLAWKVGGGFAVTVALLMVALFTIAI